MSRKAQSYSKHYKQVLGTGTPNLTTQLEVICTGIQHEGIELQHPGGTEGTAIVWPTLHVQTSIRDNILTLSVLSVLTEIGCGSNQGDPEEISMILHIVRVGLSLQSKKKTNWYPSPSRWTWICHCLTPALGSSKASSRAAFTPTGRASIEMLYKSPLTLTSVNCTFSSRQHGDNLDRCNKRVVRLVEDRHSQGCRSRWEDL